MIQNKTKDAYQWRIIYRDGSVTDEFDDTRRDGRGFAERDEKSVSEIVLMTWEPFDDREYRIPIPEGAEPVFFRRRTVIINPNDESMQQGKTRHCIGWKHGDEAVYLFVSDSGETFRTNDLQAV